jgi:hypothetical protein
MSFEAEMISMNVLQAVELRVPMCCSKCEDKVREALIEMSGKCHIVHNSKSGLVVFHIMLSNVVSNLVLDSNSW